MAPAVAGRLATDLAHALVPLKGSVRDDETLFDVIGTAPVVLIGESTCGTYEFCRARTEITKRLIADRGFTGVCVERDWSDADRVNRYVRASSDDAEPIEALGGFKRFPAWPWRNAEVLDFVAWLREYNDATAARRPKAGFYGLDLYGTYASIETAFAYLDAADPAAAQRARLNYDGSQALQIHPDHRDRIVEMLPDGRVAGAQEYYRSLFDDAVSTRALRDTHMLETLERLVNDLTGRQGPAKLVVWAHTAHGGVGALARRRFGDRAVSIGFTTYTGTVTAAARWQAPEERRQVAPARGDSYEYLFHSMKVPRMLVPLRAHRPKLAGLPLQARERAIGVVFRSQAEPDSHYVTARLIDQFDALYHFDVTHALQPL